MGLSFVEVDPDSERDTGLQRRLKRRCSASQNVVRTSSQNGARVKAPNNPDQIVNSETDEEYMLYLNSMELDCNVNSAEFPVDDDKFVGGQGSSDDADPQYKLFLENVRENGNSFVLEVEINDGLSLLLEYENERKAGKVLNQKTWKILNNCTRKENRESVRNSRNAMSVIKDKATDFEGKENGKEKSQRNVSIRGESLKTPEVASPKKNKCNLSKQRIEVADENLASRRMRGRPSKRSNADVRHSAEYEEETWDECYRVFLHCLRQDGDVLVCTDDRFQNVRIEEDDEEESSSEIEMLAREVVPGEVWNTPIEIDGKRSVDDPKSFSGTYFRKELISVLGKPYDAKEYEHLLHKIAEKRPKTVDKSLRGGREISVRLKGRCKSYLDQHPALARKINSVEGDCIRSLNLLRGFFFWLNYLPSEGAFAPWLDPSCLEVLPQLQPVKKF